MKIPNLQQIRETIQGNIIAENLAAESSGDPKQLHNGMAVVPEGTLWALVQWLQEVQLPGIAHYMGAESDEYKKFDKIYQEITRFT